MRNVEEAKLFGKTETIYIYSMYPTGECLLALPFSPMMNNKRVLQYRQFPG